MDRLTNLALVGGFGLILAATGCRSPKSEVPLGRAVVKDPAAMPQVQFSSQPSTSTAPPSMSNGASTISGLGAPPTVTIPNMPSAVPNAGQAPSLTLPPADAMNAGVTKPPRPNFGPGAAPGSDLGNLAPPGGPN